MTDSVQPARGSITQSPWYWVYLFATGGLVALILVGPKFAERQAQIEHNNQARIHAAQVAAGGDIDVPVIESTRITLWPLYVVLGCILSCAWLILLLGRRPARSQVTASASPGEALP